MYFTAVVWTDWDKNNRLKKIPYSVPRDTGRTLADCVRESRKIPERAVFSADGNRIVFWGQTVRGPSAQYRAY
jgi:hypothetical protein